MSETNESNNDSNGEASNVKERPKLEALKHKIDALKAKEAEGESESRNYVAAGPTRISLELFSGVFVGTGAGYFLDKWLGTSPLFLIVLFFLGAVAGGLNIYRIAAAPIEKTIVEKTSEDEKKIS